MATYYVKTDGSNSNTGLGQTAGTAWATMGKAASTMVAGDTCIVKDGTYVETEISFRNSGTALNPITLRAENQWLAILSSISNGATDGHPGISIFGGYVVIEDIRITDNAALLLPSANGAANCGLTLWEDTGGTNCVVRGCKIESGNNRYLAYKSRQDSSILEDCILNSETELFNARDQIIRNCSITGSGPQDTSYIVAKGGVRDAQIYNNTIGPMETAFGIGIILGGFSGASFHFDPFTGIECYNSVAYNNIVINGTTDTHNTALLFAGSQDCAFINNTCVGGMGVGSILGGPNDDPATTGAKNVNPVVKNNIFKAGSFTDFQSGRDGDITSSTYTTSATVDYNCIYGYVSDVPTQTHAITSDPLLVNPASDWTLQAGSPCINAGTTVTVNKYYGGTHSIATDFLGVARPQGSAWDLGAYESAVLSLADSVTVTDNGQRVSISRRLSAFDALTLADSVAVTFPPRIRSFDNLTVTERITVSLSSVALGATHNPLDTVAAVITSAPTLPGAGLTFTEPTFGTLLGQITGRSDEENAELTVSTINSGFNYDSTRMLLFVLGGPNNGWWIYTLDPITLLSSRTKSLASISVSEVYANVAQWDWSGNHNYRLYSIINDTSDVNRRIVWTDVESNTTGTLYNFKSDLWALTAGTVVSAATSSTFTGNQSDPEAINDLYAGQTLTFTSGVLSGQAKAILSYNATTKTFSTSPFSTIPAAGDAYHIDYVGFNSQLSVTPDARYFSWAVTEGQTSRGTAGQDAARTIFFYDSVTPTLYKHRISNAEQTYTGFPDLYPGTGIHNIQIDKLGNFVLISGGGGPAHTTLTWNPRAVNPTPATGDGTMTLSANVQHRDVGTTTWCQFKYLDANGSSNLQTRAILSPGDGSGGVQWTNPPVNGKPSTGVGYYLSWNHAASDTSFIFLELQMQQYLYGWTLDSGSVYKVAFTPFLSAGNNQLTAANHAQMRHNGALMTAAASRAAMTVGTYFYDTATDILYAWGFSSADFVNQITDVTGTVVTPGAGSNTATRFAVSYANTTPADLIGRKLYFGASGVMLYQMRTVTNYEVVGADHFVTLESALQSVPATGQYVVAMGHSIYGWDQRAYVNELMKIQLDGSGIARRITPFYGFITDHGASQFDQQSIVQSNRDGSLVLYTTQKWDGGNNAYAMVAQVPATVVTPSTGTREYSLVRIG